jgi:hypothetical protein
MPKIERPKIISGGGKIVSGGGISSNKLVRVGVKSGPASTNKISPRGVSQYGYATGSMLTREGSFTTKNSALPVNAGTMKQVPLGNQLSTNVGKGAPGAGRTVMAHGTQALHGPVHGPAPIQGRDILSEYGRDANPSSLVRKR